MSIEDELRNAETVKLISAHRKGLHWGWWLACLILWFPLLILAAIWHFTSEMVYEVVVTTKDGAIYRVVLSAEGLDSLIATVPPENFFR